jgi:hypothetical protein
MKQRKILVLFSITVAFLASVHATDPPFTITDRLFDLTNQNTVGLQRPKGLQGKDVFVPKDETHHYSNQVMMAEFKGRMFMMWQSSPTDEDTDDTVVKYAYSDNWGETWSEPTTLAKGDSATYTTSGGWYVTDNELIGYINVWNYGKRPLRVDYISTTDGIHFSERHHVTMGDGSDLEAEFGQDPRIYDGRIYCTGHFHSDDQPTAKYLCPIYTDDQRGVSGWKKGCFTPRPNNATQNKELEASLYRRADGAIVMIMRDQKNSRYVLASVSNDHGIHWTRSVQTVMPDSRSKQCAGNLPDGTVYIINNPYRVNKPRCPLVITLSKDGFTFDKAYVLRTLDELPEQRYSGWAKTLGYSYPRVTVADSCLWVSFSVQKERVRYARIPLESISLNSEKNVDQPF